MNDEPMMYPWTSEAYSDKLGIRIVSLLNPQPGERILDLGSGRGDLTAEIAAAGAIPTGIDFSAEMVNRARSKYPELTFQTADASTYRTESSYDAVFSNATLHWIQDAHSVAQSVWLSLRDGGRFVAEFAGSGNVALLTAAMQSALESRGYTWEGRCPWYLPTIGEYTSLLEQTGFRVTFAQHFERRTPLKEGISIRDWMNSFAGWFFPDVPGAERELIYGEIEAELKPYLAKEDQWFIDTSRLRIAAVKEPSADRYV
ncbi:class I SAM-dependent methyltransferase [Paenibacillus sp. GCM10023248]|uniref:class I SAM-dependent methyltransferase n=1 Tax=Bacillales TaxID=1385 RepID=UPI00285E2B34|nr:trans-aconitate methyltransferase [Bacillus sp. 3255]